jgi:hypothetical protein
MPWRLGYQNYVRYCFEIYRLSDQREHGDIPLPDLASLANMLPATGLSDEEVVRRMQEHFRLARLAQSTRDRFEAAVTMLS